MLTEQQRRALVDLAWRSVLMRVETGNRLQVDELDVVPAFGVFVTIKRGGHLRGCLGTLDRLGHLSREVARCAADAATRDPRFPPVTVAELPDLSVEVSVLGPLELIDPTMPDAITLGRHGLVVERGRQRGVLLPQVALEWQWTVEQFLRHTCLKADLPPDAWCHGAQVYRFVAEVFGD
jgi:uncharacterized protein